MDKCQREKESLYNLKMEGSYQREKEGFQIIDKGIKSYFITRKDNDYYMKYDFNTLPELKEILDNLWKNNPDMQNIIKVLLVAALKNKPQDIDEKVAEKSIKNIEDSYSSDKLPEYIYVF